MLRAWGRAGSTLCSGFGFSLGSMRGSGSRCSAGLTSAAGAGEGIAAGLAEADVTGADAAGLPPRFGLAAIADERDQRPDGCAALSTSMPVATTEMRILPASFSLKAEPKMMLASASSSSRMRLAASSTS